MSIAGFCGFSGVFGLKSQDLSQVALQTCCQLKNMLITRPTDGLVTRIQRTRHHAKGCGPQLSLLRPATVTIAACNSPEATSHHHYRRRQLGDWCTSHPNSVATRRPVASQIRKETACQDNFGSRPRLYKPAFLGF